MRIYILFLLDICGASLVRGGMDRCLLAGRYGWLTG